MESWRAERYLSLPTDSLRSETPMQSWYWKRVRSWKEATMKNFWNRKADRVLEIFQMMDEIMKAGMTSEELETLEHILDKIEDNLNQAIEK